MLKAAVVGVSALVLAASTALLLRPPHHPGPAWGHHLTVIPGGASVLVWSEVDPGTYRSSVAPGQRECAWTRSPSIDPLSPEVTEQGGGTSVTAVIGPDDKRFASTTGCLDWRRVTD